MKTRGFPTVPVALITHFVYSDQFTTAYYPGGDLLLNATMKSIEAEFGDLFVRTHRDTLIRKTAISRVEPIFPAAGMHQVWICGVEAPLRISKSGKSAIYRVRPEFRGTRHGHYKAGERK